MFACITESVQTLGGKTKTWFHLRFLKYSLCSEEKKHYFAQINYLYIKLQEWLSSRASFATCFNTQIQNMHECSGKEGLYIGSECYRKPTLSHCANMALQTERRQLCICVCVCVQVSFCLASSRHRLTGKASWLYLFINLLGTGNERLGQYILYTCVCTSTHPLIHSVHLQTTIQ